jgi:hypothetical protein
MFSGFKTFVENAAASAVEVAEAAAEAVHSSSPASSSIPIMPRNRGRNIRFSSSSSSTTLSSSMTTSGNVSIGTLSSSSSPSQYEQRKNHILQLQRLHTEILDNPEQWHEFQNTLRSKLCITTNGAIRPNLLEALETTSRSSSLLICKNIPSHTTVTTSDSHSLCSQDSSSSCSDNSPIVRDNRDDNNNEDVDEVDNSKKHVDNNNNRCRTLSSSSTDSSSVSIPPQEQELEQVLEVLAKPTRRISITGFQHVVSSNNSNSLTELTTNDIQRYEQNELKRRSKNGNISPFDSSNYSAERSKIITALNGTTAITRKFYSNTQETNDSGMKGFGVNSVVGSFVDHQQQQQRKQSHFQHHNHRRRMSLQYNNTNVPESSTINDMVVSTLKLTSNISNDVKNTGLPAPKQRRRNSIFTTISSQQDNVNDVTVNNSKCLAGPEMTTTTSTTAQTLSNTVTASKQSNDVQKRRNSLSFFQF